MFKTAPTVSCNAAAAVAAEPAAAAVLASKSSSGCVAAAAAEVVANGTADAAESMSLLFRREWQTYQKTLEHNLMFHQELFGSVEALLLAAAAAKRARCGCSPSARDGDAAAAGEAAAGAAGLDIIDVGCGDSDYICRVLRRNQQQSGGGAAAGAGLPVRSYSGVDMSQPALELSARNVASAAPGAALSYAQGDMLEFLRAAPPASADVVLASFSLHHLQPAQKREAVALAARALRPGGALVVVDIFLLDQQGDDRAAFLGRFVPEIAEAWVQRGVVAADEAQRIVEHVTHYDYPELPGSYAAWMAEAFGVPETDVRTLCVPPAGFYRAVAVELPAAAA